MGGMGHDKGGIWLRSSRSGTSRASWGELYRVGKGNLSYAWGYIGIVDKKMETTIKGLGQGHLMLKKTRRTALGVGGSQTPGRI